MNLWSTIVRIAAGLGLIVLITLAASVFTCMTVLALKLRPQQHAGGTFPPDHADCI